MTERARSRGVTLFAVYYTLGAVICLAASFPMLVLLADGQYGSIPAFPFISIIVSATLFLISSFFLFKLNPWGYRIALLPLAIYILAGHWFFALAIVIHISFFTNPRVREQFINLGRSQEWRKSLKI